MARSGFQFPISDAGRSAAALDRQIEDSLRRQFAVPAPLVNPGQLVPAHPVGDGGSWAIDFSFPRSISLRQAAGLLLAATLWGSAGILVFKHAQVARPVASIVGPQALNSDNPIAQLVTAFARTRYDDDTVLDPAVQDELWKRLEVGLSERCGSEAGSRVAKLRDSSEARIELLSVTEAFSSTEELLFVSARVDGRMSAALFETGGDDLSAHLPRPSIAPRASTERKPLANAPSTQLYKTHDGHAMGYEINAAEQPVLVQLLLPDMQLQMSLLVRPERYRRAQTALLLQ